MHQAALINSASVSKEAFLSGNRLTALSTSSYDGVESSISIGNLRSSWIDDGGSTIEAGKGRFFDGGLKCFSNLYVYLHI